MKVHCLPFAQIPHTTPLFADFLSDSPSAQQFYPRSPRFLEWFQDETSVLRYDNARRQRVTAILEQQNKAVNASPKTMENIARFGTGALAVVTGQQVGLFGGPLFSFFKALSAIRLAEHAAAAGVECVPIFWLATTDHDLAEINHTSIPSREGVLATLTTPSHGLPDAPVGHVVFGPEIENVVQQATELLGDSEAATFLRESYAPGQNLGVAFARLFSRLFADWGVILLDASAPELHRLAEPIYRTAIERATEIDDALLERGKALESAGYHQQVKVTPSSTLLFTLQDGERLPVHRRTNRKPEHDEFVIGEEKIPAGELLRRIAAAPENFSPNVLLRPVAQDYLLPTLAYTGGAAEVAYFAQAAVVYQGLLGRVTPIVPRFSATLVEPKLQRLLDKYGIALPDLFHGPEPLRETLATRTLPADLQSAFEVAKKSLQNSMESIRRSLARLDTTLLEASDHAASKMQYQLEQLRTRAGRAEAFHSELLTRHARQLSDALYPNKSLQEREVAGIYFVSRYGKDLLHQLYDAMQTDCHDHQVVSL